MNRTACWYAASTASVEQLLVRLERVRRRRLELDAWEMECQVLRDTRMAHTRQGAAMTWRNHALKRES